MAYEAFQWQASTSKNQLVLGPSGRQAVISAENFDQISTIKLPDPGRASTSVVLTDNKTGSQTVNGYLNVQGDMNVTGTVTAAKTVVAPTGDFKDVVLTGDLVFENLEDHKIRFDAAVDSGAGKALSITGNQGADKQKGGAVSVLSGAATTSSSGGLLLLQGGPGTGGASGGGVRVAGGFVGNGAGNGGNLSLFGGDSTAGGTGNGGQVIIIPGLGVASSGSVQFGLKGTEPAYANSIGTYIDLYLLHGSSNFNKFASPLNVYATKTYAAQSFKLGDGGSATTDVRCTRIGNVVTVSWGTFSIGIASSLTAGIVSSDGFMENIFRPVDNYRANVVSVDNGTVIVGMIQINQSTGFVTFTTTDAQGFVFTSLPEVFCGSCSYISNTTS